MKRFEDTELDFCLRAVSQGDLCIDVGGNIGYYAMPLARRVDPSGRVICIEPIHRNAMVIALSAELNGLSNIEVIEAVAMDIAGTASLHVPGADSAYAYVRKADASAGCDNDKVTCVTIDDLLDGSDRPVGFMKVDVEGAEELVIRGARTLLKDARRKPRMIMIELVPAYLMRFGSTMEGVLAFAAEVGYQPRRLDNGRLVALSPKDWGEVCNVFLLPDGEP